MASLCHQAFRLLVQFKSREHFFMPDATARVLIHCVHQFGNGAFTVAHHVPGNALGHGDQFVIDDQHPVIHALDKTFDQDATPARVFTGHPERRLHLLILDQVDRNTPPVVGIQRFEDHRIAQRACGPHCFAL